MIRIIRPFGRVPRPPILPRKGWEKRCIPEPGARSEYPVSPYFAFSARREAARCQEPVRLTTVLLRNRGDRPAFPLDLVQDRPTIRLDRANNPPRSLATNAQAGQAPRRASAGIASSLSSSRNKADGGFSPCLEGAPQTRPSVTALGKRVNDSLRAVPCLGAFEGT